MNGAVKSETSCEHQSHRPTARDSAKRDTVLTHWVALALEDIEAGGIDVQAALRLIPTSSWLVGYAAATGAHQDAHTGS